MQFFQILYVFCAVLLRIEHVEGQGYEFAVAFLYLDEGSNEGFTEIYLTTLTPLANVTVSGAGGFNASVLVSPNDVTIVPVTPPVRTSTGLQNNGFLVTSDNEITVQGMNSANENGDGFLAVPIHSWSTEFYAMSYSVNPIDSSDSIISVVSARANTNVQIYRRETDGSYVLEATAVLQLHQTYSLRSPTRDYTGYYITSNQPIAVISGHECAQVPLGTLTCDHVVASVPPVASFGMNYKVVPIQGRSPSTGYILRVLAFENDTYVDTNDFDDALAPVTLARGAFREYSVTQRSYQSLSLSCSKPCMVAQFNIGSAQDQKATGPFMMILTATEYFYEKYIWRTGLRTNRGTMQNLANIVIPYGENVGPDGVLLNGAVVTGVTWRTLPGLDYMYAAIEVPHGTHRVEHLDQSVQMAVYVYGHSNGVTDESYGFSAGFGINPYVTTTIAPSTTPVPGPVDILPPVHEIFVNGTWRTGDSTALSQECEEQYYNAFHQEASNVIQGLNILFGTLCGDSNYNILEFEAGFQHLSGGNGDNMVQVRLPAINARTVAQNTDCGVASSAYLQNVTNWRDPILDRVDGCPFIVFNLPFTDFLRAWNCAVQV